MLVPLNWLKDYVDIDVDIKTFTDRMTMSGSKVELVTESKDQIKNVVVGKVYEIRPHPNADRLFIAMVDVGGDKPLQIVTGASNVRMGDYVPVALEGAMLPGGVRIEAGKMRGEESQGMMCSALELAMDLERLPAKQREGIYILDGAPRPGTDITELLKLDDKVIEFEITTNRPDCLSMLGMAREAGAVFGVDYRKPDTRVKNEKGNIKDYVKGITIEAPDLCYRYVARVIDNIRIEPSPQWMQKRLIQAGMRPINNIVDITNYVMLEMGQPLHAFDLEKVGGREIIVRRASDGEELITLDGKKRQLSQDDLVIADAEVPVGLAGAMGGENTEISDSTRTILLESASFNGYNVRMTCKRLGLWSEASFRFIRGVYRELARGAADRAAVLMEQLGAGEVIGGAIDIYPEPDRPYTVEVTSARINSLLGINLPAGQMKEMLERLEMRTELDGDLLKITVPTFRQDVTMDHDVAEEIARMHGYDNIPRTIMTGSWVQGKKSRKEIILDTVKETLCGCGLYEIYTYSFESPSVFDKLMLPKDDKSRMAVTIKNPLGEEYSIMRTTLLPAMLNVLSLNYNRGTKAAGFYEIGPRFIPKEIPLKDLPIEQPTICLGLYGESNDFYSLKGIIEVLLDELNIRGYSFERVLHPSYHPGRAAAVVVGGNEIGIFGEAHPDVAAEYHIDTRAYMAELDFGLMLGLVDSDIQYRPLPRFPAVHRDLAVIVDQNVPAGDIAGVIKECGGELLEDIQLFDIYTGKQIPEGKKSVAYSVTFRSKDKTLTDEDVEPVFDRIIAELEQRLGAKLR